ncbi:MAG: hypothetical protein HWN66_14555 [Candidatus Helarchaeota archaeon]|nr:hypothetical protein [Candidatus Helarchaeota archaeon]
MLQIFAAFSTCGSKRAFSHAAWSSAAASLSMSSTDSFFVIIVAPPVVAGSSGLALSLA